METKYLRFEDLEVWKDSMRICKEVYVLIKECKDYGFKDQIKRASVSIPSNISEGYERKGKKEKIQFLYIAKGSAAEVRTQLYLAISLEYINKEKGMELINQLSKLSIMIYNYISTINTALHG